MQSVEENEYVFEIKNSKFISLIFHLTCTEDVERYLRMVKIKYPEATHYCYSYIFGEKRYSSDDGEPSGTAGIPILLVLEKKNLNHVLCIVVRYFGKIKLGAGGLVRAYTKAASECIKNHIIFLKEGYLIEITFSYSSLKEIDYLLKKKKILKKDFQNEITYQFNIGKEELKEFQSKPYLKVKILDKIYFREEE